MNAQAIFLLKVHTHPHPHAVFPYSNTHFFLSGNNETHSLWSYRCWLRASCQSSSSSLVSVLNSMVSDPSGDGLMMDSRRDFWPAACFSITRMRVSCEMTQMTYHKAGNESKRRKKRALCKILNKKAFLILQKETDVGRTSANVACAINFGLVV